MNVLKEAKAHVLIFSGSVSRAAPLDLVPNSTTQQFIKCLKHLIARRGRPNTIYLDNAKAFNAATKWFESIIKRAKEYMNIYQDRASSGSY